MKSVLAITNEELEGLPSPPTTAPNIEGLSQTTSSSGQSQAVRTPDPEVSAKPSRRRFTAAYKLSILQEADRCASPGQLGVLLRREGLYSSHLSLWRKQRRKGTLAALAPSKRGPKPHPRNPLAEEVEQLRRENQSLTHRLKQAETIIEFQKKVSEILGIPLSQPEEKS